MLKVLTPTACTQLSEMLLAVIFFHSSEYLLAIAFHGRANVTSASLLMRQNYLIAIVFSLVEYLIEVRFFPQLKEHWWISYFGLAVVVIGQIVRKMAFITAGTAFTHRIRTSRDEHHKLVTHGIYRYMRHPGYSGFFIFSVGTQIMLCNPVSTIGFPIVLWRFFYHQIPYEEYYLRRFFGFRYDAYARRVPSGVPFVR